MLGTYRHQEALYHAQISVRITHFLVQDMGTYIEYLEYKEMCLRDVAPKKDEGSSTKSL